MQKAGAFKSPPKTTNSSGKERTAGYEFEFTGLPMGEAAGIIASLYGGRIEQKSSYEVKISETEFGDFSVELDAQLIRDKEYESILKKIGFDFSRLNSKSSFENSLMELASSVVPFEIITPPVRLSDMVRLEELISELRRKKARGTKDSFFYAFGLHINPEVSSFEISDIADHLRAYVLLDSWIRDDAEIDISRRITPYINEYDRKYIKHLIDPKYQPDLQTFIRDYFIFDNSRNRPLDLLPLFMHLDEEFTESLLDESLTSARPTWHYRLPNCSLEDVNWSLSAEWNRWVLVEQLAHDKESLQKLCRYYLKLESSSIMGFENKWIDVINVWLKENE